MELSGQVSLGGHNWYCKLEFRFETKIHPGGNNDNKV